MSGMISNQKVIIATVGNNVTNKKIHSYCKSYGKKTVFEMHENKKLLLPTFFM